MGNVYRPMQKFPTKRSKGDHTQSCGCPNMMVVTQDKVTAR